MNIAIIGGGRWARVLTEVVQSIDVGTKIFLCSDYNHTAIKEWTHAKQYKNILLKRSLGDIPLAEVDAMIVVNAARSHEHASLVALKNRIPVLIEKPITLSSKSTINLFKLSKSFDTKICSAHVFLYADYLNNFFKRLSTNNPKSIEFSWVDGIADKRNGEVKTYDPSVPLFADCLPHIHSILRKQLGFSEIVFKNLEYYKGGSHLVLYFIIDNIPSKILLQRKGEKRLRFLKIEGNTILELNFSSEPGEIKEDSMVISGDSAWDTKPSPATQMISSFMHYCTDGAFDKRLDYNESIESSLIVDKIDRIYKREQKTWLDRSIGSQKEFNENVEGLKYFFEEIFHQHNIKIANSLDEERLALFKSLAQKDFVKLKENILIKDFDNLVS